jgi:glycogen synthase
MTQDWGWATSAKQYSDLYRATANQVRRRLVTGSA